MRRRQRVTDEVFRRPPFPAQATYLPSPRAGVRCAYRAGANSNGPQVAKQGHPARHHGPARFSLSGCGEGGRGRPRAASGPRTLSAMSWPPEQCQTGCQTETPRIGTGTLHSATRSRSHQRLTGPISVNSRSFCLEICLPSLALLELISASPYRPRPRGKLGFFPPKMGDHSPSVHSP